MIDGMFSTAAKLQNRARYGAVFAYEAADDGAVDRSGG
jgi:hypothetical protein